MPRPKTSRPENLKTCNLQPTLSQRPGVHLPYTEKFENALVYTACLHRVQTRKGTGVPYVTHLLAVAAIVGENGGTEDEVVAALLHDAPEDAGGEARLAEIRARFGDPVADIVAGCTDTYEDPKPPWRARKEAYLDHLAGAPAPVRLVSAADKLHNARSVLADYQAAGEDLWDRFNGGRDGTLWYYRAVADALRRAGNGPLVDELDRVVTDLERLAGNGVSEPGPR
jgi:(p)ppGpp synthase/HD superfamily hydrolase